MEVSAITSFNPNRFDWRNMTAKEIIKHKDEGVDVPSVYLQWAIEFINNIYSDDDTTYEVSVSSQKNADSKAENEEALNTEENNEINNTEEKNQVSENSKQEEEPKLNAAQSLRTQMDEEGVSLLRQALAFADISDANKDSSFILRKFILPVLEGKSDNEIQQLAFGLKVMEAQMNKQADNMKSIMTNTGHDNVDDEIQIQAAYDLGEKLEKTAIKGHQSITGGETNLEDLGVQMIDSLTTLVDTIDFGNETIDIGEELNLDDEALYFLFINLTSMIINSGRDALNEGLLGVKKEDESEKANEVNKNTASGYHNFIEEKTGIADPEKVKDEKDKNNTKKAAETNTDNEENSEIGNDKSSKQEDKSSGTDERTKVISLRNESKSADDETLASMNIASELANSSNEEYTDLTNDIRSIINEIDGMRNEIIAESRNTQSNTMGSNIARINQLNEEIRQFGGEAQTLAGSSEGLIDNYASAVQEIGDIFNEAINVGNETVNAGNDLINGSQNYFRAFKYVNEIIGKAGISTGSKAAKDGQSGMKEQNTAMSGISGNLSGVNNVQSEVHSKTGVEAVNGRNNEPKETDKKQDLVNKNANENKKKESEKEIKTAQNDGTDTTDKLNISLDELVKRKVRRGEYAKEA